VFEKILGNMTETDIGAIGLALNKITEDKVEITNKRKKFIDKLINDIDNQLTESKFK
jgi:hypothetical protein